MTASKSTRWTEIKVAVPTHWHELVAEALGHALCTTVQVGDHSIAHSDPGEGNVHLRSYVPTAQDSPEFRSEIQSSLDRLIQVVDDPDWTSVTPRYKPLPPEDYATSWKKSWKAFRLRRAGRALVVTPPWDNDVPPGEFHLVLEPGGAFGSGRHATTRTCMAVALERIQGGESVLDAGSGSGILGVTSVLLGAANAFGFDVDPNATPIANDLARSNGVAGSATFVTGEIDCIGETTFDVVFANIYSDVIVDQAVNLRNALRLGGWFAFSGCPNHHVEKTRTAIENAGLTIEEERQRGRWHTFVGHRTAKSGMKKG